MCDSPEQLLLSLHLCPLQSQHFREKKYIYHLFICSFIPFLPLPHFQNEQEAICDSDSPPDFTRGLCWTSLIHTLQALLEVNVLAAFPCKYYTSTKLLIFERALSCFCLPSAVLCVLNNCQQGGKVTNSVPVSNIEIGHSVGVQVPAQQQLLPGMCADFHFT